MGNRKHYNGHDYSGSESDHLFVPGYVNWNRHLIIKRPGRKMEAKFIILFIVDLLGITWTVKGMVTKIDNVKEAILFVVLMLYALTRYYFYVKRQWRLEKKEEHEQRVREKTNKP